MAKRLIPLLDRVLVEKIVAPTKSVGGVLLPDSAVSKVRWVWACQGALWHWHARTHAAHTLSPDFLFYKISKHVGVFWCFLRAIRGLRRRVWACVAALTTR